jgi:nicotinate-nucleotide pyrophosphorylase (carboxylating)
MTEKEFRNALPTYLSLDSLDQTIRTALLEDVGSGDVTTAWTVPPSIRGSGRLISKANGILAGKWIAWRIFQSIDPDITIRWTIDDSELVHPGDLIATLSGPLGSMLTGERVMLNFLQRMSGIATATRAFVDVLAPTNTRLLDTRKTVPGLRLTDKWAVKMGGGVNHRIGLYDEVMIKDNHIAASGGIAQALRRVELQQDPAARKPVVVEVVTLEQIREVFSAGVTVDRLLLDNMVRKEGSEPDVSLLSAAVRLVDGRIRTEASGNVSLATALAIAETGVDFVSVGALTHSVSALDISLQLEPINST